MTIKINNNDHYLTMTVLGKVVYIIILIKLPGRGLKQESSYTVRLQDTSRTKNIYIKMNITKTNFN